MTMHRHVRFRDARPPHEIQFGLEGEWTTPLTPAFVDGSLEYQAQIRMTDVHYAFRFVFEAALRDTNVYSLHIDAIREAGPAGDRTHLERSSAGWFDFWTRGLKPAAAAREGEASVERYRELCDTALRAESHLSDIAAIQREILAAMRDGATLSSAHKEGGTTIAWERDRFVIADYGDFSSRQEFTDDAAFLAALWKRYEWQTTRHTAPKRVPEYVAWKLILRQIRRTPVFPQAPVTRGFRTPSRMMLPVALVVLVLALAGFGVARLLTVRSIGAPFGASTRAGDAIATLVRTQEPYLPRLHRRPDRDRFRIDLLLTPIIGEAGPRSINLARDLDRAAFHPGTKLLGTDGPLLWMLVPELKAVDLRSHRLITLKDLRAANPALEEIWHTARFHYTDRLHLMSADRQRTFTVDPDTLRARADDKPLRIAWQNPADSPYDLLCQGGPIGATEWLIALTAAERESSFRPGSTFLPDRPAEKSRDARTLHRLSVEPVGPRLRVVSITPVLVESYVDGALIRAARGSAPLALGEPAGVLLAHRTGPVLQPSIVVTRVDAAGKAHWTCNTGLRDLDQVLPDPKYVVLVGRLPAPEGKVPATVAAVIDTATGTLTTRRFQP